MDTIPTPIKLVTVCSYWWSNRFFGTKTDRDDDLQRLSQPYLNADNNLDFVPIFTEMDGIIRQFLATTLKKGISFIKMWDAWFLSQK
jgi:hypothetical protein